MKKINRKPNYQCAKWGRKYICIEKEKDYYDIMQSRINAVEKTLFDDI